MPVCPSMDNSMDPPKRDGADSASTTEESSSQNRLEANETQVTSVAHANPEVDSEEEYVNSKRSAQVASLESLDEKTTMTGTASTPASTPGAVAVPGAATAETTVVPGGDEGSEEEESPSSHRPLDEMEGQTAEVTTAMVDESPVAILEATPVHEIVATRVEVAPEENVQPLPSTHPPLNIQHVDIDNFDYVTTADTDSPTAEEGRDTMDQREQSQTSPETEKIVRSKVISIVSTILVVYTALSYVFIGLLAPDREDIENDRDDQVPVTACLLAQEESILWLERMLAGARVEIIVADIAVVIIVYQMLDRCQDYYCRATPAEPKREATYYVNLILWMIEFLWILTALSVVLTMEFKGLRTPSDSLREVCPSRTYPQLDEMEDLTTFYIVSSIRPGLLIFVLIVRSRIVLGIHSQAQDHLTAFWQRFWYWILIVMDFVCVGLTAFGLMELIAVMVDVEDFDTLYGLNP